jgi:peptidoglycan hydrolase-like protein with peptidoglycan-binding domain
MEYPLKYTPLSRDEAAKTLVAAFDAAGVRLDRNAAELLLSQVWLENGGGKNFVQYNWGNLTASEGSSADYWRPQWYTVDDSSSARMKYEHDQMLAGKAPSKFLAFQSHIEGASTYARWIVGKFKSILQAASTGDVSTFANAVRSSGYCPDCNPAVTVPTFSTFQKQFQEAGIFAALPLSPPEPGSGPEPSSPPAPSPSSPQHFEVGLGADLHLLRQGSHGSIVWAWQLVVGANADGDFGPLTKAATLEWQKLNGLDQDGMVKQADWETLLSRAAALTPSGEDEL